MDWSIIVVRWNILPKTSHKLNHNKIWSATWFGTDIRPVYHDSTYPCMQRLLASNGWSLNYIAMYICCLLTFLRFDVAWWFIDIDIWWKVTAWHISCTFLMHDSHGYQISLSNSQWTCIQWKKPSHDIVDKLYICIMEILEGNCSWLGQTAYNFCLCVPQSCTSWPAQLDNEFWQWLFNPVHGSKHY